MVAHQNTCAPLWNEVFIFQDNGAVEDFQDELVGSAVSVGAGVTYIIETNDRPGRGDE